MDSLTKTLKAFESDAPTRVGRVAQRKALGIFKVEPAVIRIKTANDISTATHEVGHAIEKAVFGWPKGGPWAKSDATMKAELTRLGKELYVDTMPKGGYKREGFAEFIHFYVTDREAAKKKAPVFFDWFQSEFLKDHPNGGKALDKSTAAYRRFAEQTPTQRVGQSIVDTGTVGQRIKRGAKKFASFFSFRSHVDMLYPLFILDKAAKAKGAALPISKAPGRFAEAVRLQHDAIVGEMAEGVGMVDPAGSIVGPPLKDIRGLIRARGRDWTIYMYARRAKALWEDPKKPEGRNPGISLSDANAVIEDLSSHEFELAADKFYEWNDGVLNYAAALSPDFAVAVEQIRAVDPGNYIPLQREFEKIDSALVGVQTSVNRAEISKRLKGSGRRILHPIQQAIQNATHIIGSAHRRRILENLIDLSENVEDLGHLVERVPREQVPAYSATIRDLVDRLNVEFGDLGEIDVGSEIGEKLITFFVPETRPKGRDPVIPIYRKGNLEFYQVPADLFDAMQGVNQYRFSSSLIYWAMVAPKRVFVTLTTGIRASFGLVTNPARDLPTMYVNSKANAKGLSMLWAWSQSMAEALAGKRGPYFSAYMATGGQMGTPLAGDIDPARRASRRIIQGRTVRLFDPRNAFDLVRDLVQLSESVPRVAELRRVAKDVGWEPGQPMTLDQSLEMRLAAKQVTTDFTAGGSFGRAMNQIVPFWNAQIQGPRANVRAALRNPMKFAIRAMSIITVPTLLLWWRYKDEPWYKELTAKERFLNWHIPVDIDGKKELIRIPRPFDIGQVFGSMPEAFLAGMYEDEPELATEWFLTFLDTAIPDPRPVIVREAMQQFRNWDDFWDRPVVKRSLLRKPPEEQFDEYTSRAAIMLGETFGVSPKRIDHAIRNAVGPVAADVVEVIGLGPKGLDREKELADLSVVGRVFRRGGPMGTGGKSIEALYDRMDQANILQLSDRHKETEDERHRRLMLNDATRVVSNMFYIRSHTPKDAKRRAITKSITEFAKEAVARYDSGERHSRALFKLMRRATDKIRAGEEFDTELEAAIFIGNKPQAATESKTLKQRRKAYLVDADELAVYLKRREIDASSLRSRYGRYLRKKYKSAKTRRKKMAALRAYLPIG